MAGTGRVQFVITGWSLGFLLLSAGFLFAGFWLYTHPPPPPPPEPGPPYFVNKVATAIRPCFQCLLADGKMKARAEWKLGKVSEIPTDEKWWFAVVEDPASPVAVDGVPMLPLHPAKDHEKPWTGFNERQVMLVVYQDLEPKYNIEHPTPPPTEAEAATPADSETPADRPQDADSAPSTAPQEP